jgi:hypothetical protein
MDEVRIRLAEKQRYASRAKQLPAEQIDAFVRESVATELDAVEQAMVVAFPLLPREPPAE